MWPDLLTIASIIMKLEKLKITVTKMISGQTQLTKTVINPTFYVIKKTKLLFFPVRKYLASSDMSQTARYK